MAIPAGRAAARATPEGARGVRLSGIGDRPGSSSSAPTTPDGGAFMIAQDCLPRTWAVCRHGVAQVRLRRSFGM
jgi:hypothetical protein